MDCIVPITHLTFTMVLTCTCYPISPEHFSKTLPCIIRIHNNWIFFQTPLILLESQRIDSYKMVNTFIHVLTIPSCVNELWYNSLYSWARANTRHNLQGNQMCIVILGLDTACWVGVACLCFSGCILFLLATFKLVSVTVVGIVADVLFPWLFLFKLLSQLLNIECTVWPDNPITRMMILSNWLWTIY